MAVIAQQTHPAEIPQHRRYGLLCAALVDFIRLLGVDAEGVRFSDLPVVVQSGRVDGLRSAHDHIGQTEQIAQTGRLVAGIHNAHMGHKIAGQIAFFCRYRSRNKLSTAVTPKGYHIAKLSSCEKAEAQLFCIFGSENAMPILICTPNTRCPVGGTYQSKKMP